AKPLGVEVDFSGANTSWSPMCIVMVAPESCRPTVKVSGPFVGRGLPPLGDSATPAQPAVSNRSPRPNTKPTFRILASLQSPWQASSFRAFDRGTGRGVPRADGKELCATHRPLNKDEGASRLLR